MVLNKRRDVENGLRALLREAGLKVGTPCRRNFAVRIELVADDPMLAALTRSLLSVIAVMTEQIGRLSKRVLAKVRIEPTCRRLMTVQGVGPFAALAFRAAIGPADHAMSAHTWASHPGATNPARLMCRAASAGAAMSSLGQRQTKLPMLTRSTKWSALRAWGMNVAKRRGLACARVAVARKLAVILHRIWADGTEFRWTKQAAASVPAA
jgi:transposase